ncbi:alpha/beta hydrolase [Janibacter corallicola]|uniref:alpha/beta hydrolase n=1 Tax=Janibacter corallicola TaxID=415212 RepID=UPI00082D2234|nr:alpha/beta hydrolase [Janibacter corallicola]
MLATTPPFEARWRSHLRTRRWAALVAALALPLTGCSVLSPGPEPSGLDSESAAPLPEDKADLKPFYEQQLKWGDCPTGPGECAQLKVPVDWSKPKGETMKIGVYRAKATGDSAGSLVVNPGGPGGSGMDYAAAADQIVSSEVRRHFDIVGFDPRGVGVSEPIDCLTDPELDDFLGQDPTPDDTAERKEAVSIAKDFAKKCEERVGTELQHVSTKDAAQDMDALRAVLGDAKLNYLGKSYGTYLGTLYAENFPKNVGRMVLDGAVPPDVSTLEFDKGQAKGFDDATTAWAKDCVSQTCPLGSNVEEVTGSVQDLLKELDEKPISGSGGLRLTEGWATMGIAQAMYDEAQWWTLTKAIVSAQEGDGGGLMSLAMQYAMRDPSGGYSSNLMESFRVISCADRQPTTSVEDWSEYAAKIKDVAPILGGSFGWQSSLCAVWPTQAEEEPHEVSAKGADPILVVGTTNDPATPYRWAKRLDDQLADSTLLTYEGEGHTAYRRGSDCVDKAVDNYWLTGELPKREDRTCSS